MGSLVSRLIRWPIYGSVVLFGLAAAVGHWIAPEEERRPALSVPAPIVTASGSAWFVDPEHGVAERFVSDAPRLEQAAVSPWQDGWRTRQVVGRWIETTGEGNQRVQSASGLARLSYPDGGVIDRFETDVLPGGPPCWTSPTGDVVVFASTGGRLYRFAFTGSRHRLAIDGRDPGPIPVGRAEDAPEIDELHDLSRPYGTGCAGLYLASVKRPGRRPRETCQEIWWLRLDAEGMEVLDGGRLTEASEGSGIVERFPVLGRGPAGELLLAYLSKRPSAADWSLRVAPVAIETAGGGAPIRVTGPTRELGGNCAASPPTFRPDGRSLLVVAAEGGLTERPRLRRVELGEEGPAQ